jgi:hypothetical protein
MVLIYINIFIVINKISEEGVGLWCLTPFSTILPIYREGQALIGGEPEYLEKTTELP